MVERKRVELPPPSAPEQRQKPRREKPSREKVAKDLSEKSKRGRPSTYQARYAKIALVLCSRGATDSDLADAFDVTTVCISKWQSMHPEFGAAVCKGKVEMFDPKVERACAQLAIGYSVDTEEVKVTKDGDIIRYPIRKHFPPNATACIFWLKNRQPGKWRDVWKIEHEGKVELESLTAQQLLDEIRKEAAELGIMPTALGTLGVAPEKASAKTTNGSTNGTKH